MKRVTAVFILSLSVFCTKAQNIQTIVPKQVVTGNAFQIQYIISDPSSFESINLPNFDNLQLISGPNYYKGNSLVDGKTVAVENIAYTVVPVKSGTIRIEPALIKFKNGREEATDEVLITAIPQPKASFNSRSTYTDINLYAPSSKTDLDKLIEANLFIRAKVDKRICFLGEAITATFKLYSRLQSTSEVINAPSLYGFSVMDILDINEAHQAVENIKGSIFNTSVLRKLQLYPSQTGTLTIDEMQLQNVIEFDDSSTGKKIEVEKLLASNPVEITVRPLPLPKPVSYTGAVGQFTVNANVSNTKIKSNGQGKLIVTIEGEGNFIQFGPPAIQWPKDFDVFEPVVEDVLDKNKNPAQGRRKYVFNFIANGAGSFVIPPVHFSFFDPSLHRYQEVSTDSLKVEIVPGVNSQKEDKKDFRVLRSTNTWIYFSVILLLLASAIVLLLWRRKEQEIEMPAARQTNYLDRLNEIVSQQLSDKLFCFEIQKLLKATSKEYNLTEEQKQEFGSIQNDCQLLIYSDINSENKREELQKRVGNLLHQLGA